MNKVGIRREDDKCVTANFDEDGVTHAVEIDVETECIYIGIVNNQDKAIVMERQVLAELMPLFQAFLDATPPETPS